MVKNEDVVDEEERRKKRVILVLGMDVWLRIERVLLAWLSVDARMMKHIRRHLR